MSEIWKDIAGYEGLYQVSNLGNVKSLEHEIPQVRRTTPLIYHHKETMLKKHSDGRYLSVVLQRDGGRKRKLIHRLVAEAFIPNPNNFETINHKDEDKTNNYVDNLEWMSLQDNLLYGTRLERIRKKNLNNPKRAKRIGQYTMDGTLICEYPSYCETRRSGYYNIWGTVHNSHNRHQAYGYVWKELDVLESEAT